MTTKAETEFMARMMELEPEIHRALTAAGKGQLPAGEAPWLSETLILWPQSGNPQDTAMAEGHPLPALRAMLDAFHPIAGDWKKRCECAEHITELMACPLTMLLAALTSASANRPLPPGLRMVNEESLLRTNAEDFVIEFSGHLWDASPIWTTGRFAGEMVTIRLDIEAATQRARTGTRLEDLGADEDEALLLEIAAEASNPSGNNPANWLSDQGNWRKAFGWYAGALGNSKTGHYRLMTSGQYASALMATPRARAAQAHDQEAKNSPAQKAAFKQVKRALDTRDKIHTSLQMNSEEGFIQAMNEARMMNAEATR